MTEDQDEARRGKRKGARPNREGKPWHRSDGRWIARVYPPKGTIETKAIYVYGKTRAEAIQNRKDREAELARGLGGNPDMPLGDYFARWLYETLPEYVRAGAISESTMDSYRDNAELHIVPDKPGVPTLRHIRIGELNAKMVREWQDKLSQKPSGRQRRKLRPGETQLPPPVLLSPRTVAYNREILHKALEDAIRDEVGGIERNVVDLVDPPKDRRKKTRPTIHPEQAAALLVEMGEDRLWCYWLVAFAQGFRRGEGLGMRWQDLELEAMTWTPELTVQRLRGDKDPETGRRKGKLVAKELKTEASGEKTALARTAAEALAQWRTEQAKLRLAAVRWADLDLVFTTGYGTALEPRNVNRAWEALCARAGVPGVRLHDLRHACASYLLAAGADLKSVQRTLRHSRLATTELYLHAIEEVPRAAADTMDEVIAGLRAMDPGKSGR